MTVRSSTSMSDATPSGGRATSASAPAPAPASREPSAPGALIAANAVVRLLLAVLGAAIALFSVELVAGIVIEEAFSSVRDTIGGDLLLRGLIPAAAAVGFAVAAPLGFALAWRGRAKTRAILALEGDQGAQRAFVDGRGYVLEAPAKAAVFSSMFLAIFSAAAVAVAIYLMVDAADSVDGRERPRGALEPYALALGILVVVLVASIAALVRAALAQRAWEARVLPRLPRPPAVLAEAPGRPGRRERGRGLRRGRGARRRGGDARGGAARAAAASKAAARASLDLLLARCARFAVLAFGVGFVGFLVLAWIRKPGKHARERTFDATGERLMDVGVTLTGALMGVAALLLVAWLIVTASRGVARILGILASDEAPTPERAADAFETARWLTSIAATLLGAWFAPPVALLGLVFARSIAEGERDPAPPATAVLDLGAGLVAPAIAWLLVAAALLAASVWLDANGHALRDRVRTASAAGGAGGAGRTATTSEGGSVA